MTIDTIIELGHQAILIAVKLSAPILLLTLIVGLFIAILQAATQVNEMTLSFVPKLIAMAILFLFAGSWMLESLVDYTRNLIRAIPGMIG
ncbi:flagellar biosynthesis protein FliQ [Candidatus Woesearchaeota archaeon]|jgi:flagellar biosynthetic protein FliQ|nr:flagellar biosynthesis protein FliQ [Candidatus Woesearchaeota archaeon]